jgi:hypothetical protein
LDKARILAAIQSRLVAGNIGATDNVQVRTPQVPAGGLAIGKLAALTAGVLAAVAAFVLFNGAKTEVQPPEVAVAPGVSTAASEATAPNGASEPAVPSTASAVTAAPAPRSVIRINDSDRLAEEVVLLTRAEREFHAGDLRRALTIVDEHGQKFSKGALAQERNSLRLRVLCGLGRNDEAQAEAKRLGRLSRAAASAHVCDGVH